MSDRQLAGVVLAAGAGTRLRPLTEHLPKALCPVANIPLVDLALRRLAPYAGSLAVNVHHHRDAMLRHLDGRVHCSVESPVALGTAGALGRLRGWLDGRDVLVTNADSYLAGSLDPLVGGWDGERPRLLTVAAPGRGDFGDERYVGACLLPWPLVSRLTEEPSGLYEAMWRDLWLGEGERGLGLVRFGGTAVDCGTPADYLAANLHAAGEDGAVAGDATVTGTVERSVVGAGALVEGTVRDSVVWPGGHVAPGESLRHVVRAGRDLTVDARAPSGHPAR